MQKKQRKKKQTGRWTQDQHARFLEAVIEHGKNWKLVQQAVKTRTTPQVRSHAQKFFNRLTKTQRSILLPFQGQQHQEIIDNKNNIQSPNKQNQATQILFSINDLQNQESQSEQQQQGHDSIQICQQGPPRLIDIIKKSSNEGKDKLEVKNLVQKLNCQKQIIKEDILKKKSSSSNQNNMQVQKQIKDLQQSNNHLNNLSNLLIAYITLSESEQSHDQAFFLTVIRKYRKFIYKNQFFKLIDIPQTNFEQTDNHDTYSGESRKKSFSAFDLQQIQKPQNNGIKLQKNQKQTNSQHTKKENQQHTN